MVRIRVAVGALACKCVEHVGCCLMGNELDKAMAAVEDMSDEELAQSLWKLRERLVGRQVADLRKAAGVTQGELARQMSVGEKTYTQSTVAKIEKAMRPTSVGELYVIADALKVDIKDLFTPPGGLQTIQNQIVSVDARISQLQTKAARAHEEAELYNQELHGLQVQRAELSSQLDSLENKTD